MKDVVKNLQERLDKERSARLQAESLLDTKSKELYEVNRQLLELTGNLEREVKVRTSELKSARDQALASAKAKSDFVANMSHELRTPLNGVIGMLYSLKNCESKVQQKALIQAAMDSSKLLITVINDILEFSKIESVGVELECVEVDLSECIESIAHSFSVSARAKQVELITMIDPKLPRLVRADGFRLQQIVGNLISNAIKFTDSGYVKVQVDYLGSGRVYIAVRDTGVGISEEQGKRIFNAFNQADTSVARKFGGTGLGLSICAAIAEAMGTEINIKSKLGEGAEFSLLLNLSIVDEGSICRQLRDLVTPSMVAVVSDSPMTVEIFKRLFDDQRQIDLKVYDSLASFRLLGFNRGTPTVVFIDFLGEIAKEVKSTDSLLQCTDSRIATLLYYDQLGDKLAATTYQVLKPLRNQEIVDAVCLPDATPKLGAGEQDHKIVFVGKRVLVVDDNAVNLQVAENLLREYGLEVEQAKNGQEAIDIIKSTHYDLVFMDVQMPVKDGISAVKTLRASGYTPTDLPIVAMTAHASREDRVKSLAAGMNDHMTKPLDPRLLESTLVQFLGDENLETVARASCKRNSPPEIVLPEIEGFDVEEAVARLNGNFDLWRKLSIQFCDMFVDSRDELEQYLATDSYQSMAELTHRIKGTGANLGAMTIANAAAAVEAAIKSDQFADVSALIEILSNALRQLPEIKSLLHDAETVPDRPLNTRSVERAHVIELLEGIKSVLNADYTESENLVNSLSRLCDGSDFAEIAQHIHNCFDDFEYDELLAAVDEFVCLPESS